MGVLTSYQGAFDQRRVCTQPCPEHRADPIATVVMDSAPHRRARQRRPVYSLLHAADEDVNAGRLRHDEAADVLEATLLPAIAALQQTTR